MYEYARKYKLSQPHAGVLEGIISLCKKSEDGVWCGTKQELANYVLFGRMTASRSLNFLVKKGIVVKRADGYKLAQNEQGYAQNEQKNARNEQKEERSKEEKVNKKESSVSKDDTTTQTPFSCYWDLASPEGLYHSYRVASIKIWERMPEDWRKLAIERVVNKPVERNAYYYLKDEDYLNARPAPYSQNNGSPKKTSPRWLTEEEQHSLMKNGEILYFCERTDGVNPFGTVTAEDAKAFGLKVVRDVFLGENS